MGEFLGGLVSRIPGSHCRGPGSIPGRGTEIPQAVQRGKKKKKIIMDLEIIILSEESQTEKDKYHMMLLICRI